MNELRADQCADAPRLGAAAEHMLWKLVETVLEQSGWAAALVAADGEVKNCNRLFEHHFQALVGDPGVNPGADRGSAEPATSPGDNPHPSGRKLVWSEEGGAVEQLPAELLEWQSSMFRVSVQLVPANRDGEPGKSRPRRQIRRGIPSQMFTCLPLCDSRYRLIFAPIAAAPAASPDLMFLALEQSGVSALITDAEANTVYVNRRFSEMTGYSQDLILGRNPRILKSGRTPQKVYYDMWSRLHAGQSWEGRVLNRKFNGDHFWSFQTVSPLYGPQQRLAGYLSLSHDSTAIHEDYLSLHQLAYYDSLCGIANRRALQGHLNKLLDAVHNSPGLQVALLFLNLDNFKLINDGYGHEAGDAVLQAVCNRIVQRNYLDGFIARLGGDEFAVVVQGGIDERVVVEFADALLAEVTRSILVDGHSISVSASVGVAIAPMHAGQCSLLMKCADTATRAAKEAGRNRSVVFSRSMLQTGDARIAERGVLTRALEHNELFPVFQPVVSCSERAVAYYESLVRWRHPELGQLAPAVFLPAFQQFGLLTRLNSWMLDHACEELARLGPNTCLSLNIAAPDLMLDDYADRVMARLQHHGVDPTRVRLEITEGELIENFAACERSIAQPRAAGMRFYIDDFGVGYASLAYLKRLPVDGIKLDRSFLQDFPSDNQAVDIIASVIGLAHRLGLEVTAEGVEEMEQARLLSELGCDYLQGFLFGKPGLTEWLPTRYI